MAIDRNFEVMQKQQPVVTLSSCSRCQEPVACQVFTEKQINYSVSSAGTGTWDSPGTIPGSCLSTTRSPGVTFATRL